MGKPQAGLVRDHHEQSTSAAPGSLGSSLDGAAASTAGGGVPGSLLMAWTWERSAGSEATVRAKVSAWFSASVPIRP
ncbi:hypothetical protein AHiyo8_15750 [Arthrobacter sp. Hiyo8]|nr:hypothetical protein AHiyo8_15750 [Arthrobacter sp. Hiyo8]